MLLPLAAARTLFADSAFRRTWAIGTITGIIRWFEFVALAIFTYELTRSPQMVALLAVLRMLPYAMLGTAVGGLADVVDRARLLQGSLLAMAIATIAMAVLAAIGQVSYAAVAVATLAAGVFWTVDMPARRRLMVDAVGPARMAAGLGFDNASMHATRALGPLAGGALYEWLGLTGVYVMMAVGYAACLALAHGLKVAPRPAGPQRERVPLWSVVFPVSLLKDQRMRVAMGVTLVYNLWCFPFSMMVPVIAQNDFQLPHLLVGLLTACDGLGGVAGALLVGAVVREATLFRFYFLGTVIYLFVMLVMSLHLTVAVAVPALIAIGIASAAFSTTQYALIYVLAPVEMRGRATGLLSIFIGSSLIGHYHAGLMFEWLGSAVAVRVMAAEGIVVSAMLGLAWWRARSTTLS